MHNAKLITGRADNSGWIPGQARPPWRDMLVLFGPALVAVVAILAVTLNDHFLKGDGR